MIRVGIPVLAGFLAGCGGSPIGVSDESGTGSGGSSGASPTSTGASLSTGSSSTGHADASSSSSSSSSTTAELDGPGCGEPPACEGAVLEGSVRIESSADLAQLEGISVVTGFVEIIDTDLECLDTLLCLQEVGRDLRLQDNAALRSTAGLSNVSLVGSAAGNGGDVIIAQNPVLASLEGFALERLDGVVAVWRNDALNDISGFMSLRRLESLSVQDNPALESLEGLHELRRLSSCDVNHNETLCLSQVFAVCGGLEPEPNGVTDFNDDDC